MKIDALNGLSITAPQKVQKHGPKVQTQNNVRDHVSTPLNLHKNQILFGRHITEHRSWGATVNKDGTINFKVPTFPDAKKVYIEILKNPKDEEMQQFWSRGLKVERGENEPADDDFEVTSIQPIDKSSTIVELEKKGGGIFEKKNIEGIKPGLPYRVVVVDKDNHIENSKDPYSKEQRQVLTWSTIHDPNNFAWTDSAWMAGKVSDRITRQEGSKLKNYNAARIMEISIPTITPEGDFKSAKRVLKEIATKNLANTIEIMPVENCFSKQWGYDGVDKFAINERLGTSAELKELINYAHELKLNVIMDMVPNHIGVDGDTLRLTGPFEKFGWMKQNDGSYKWTTKSMGFGPLLNYEGYEGKNGGYVGDGNKETRNWMANVALHWAEEYHVDGLRLDMTKPYFMESDYTLKQIAAEVNHHYPDVVMIAEDGMGNRPMLTNKREYIENHNEAINSIDAQVEKAAIEHKFEGLDGLGFDSEWDFVFMHELENAVGIGDGFDIWAFDRAFKNSKGRVAYALSHDEQGNNDGTSFMTKIIKKKLGVWNPHSMQKMLEVYATGKLENMSLSEWRDYTRDLNTDYISKDQLQNAYYYATKKAKLAAGTVSSRPGPKMFFQGFEKGSLDYFKFFRDFSTPENQRDTEIEKGYKTETKSALADSLPNRIKYSGIVKKHMDMIEKFNIDLANIVDENPALQDGEIIEANTVVHPQGNSGVYATHCKKDMNEIFSIKNFTDTPYDNYGIKFPEGEWVEVLNSSDQKYGSSSNYLNKNHIHSDGRSDSNIKLTSTGITFFKRIG